MSMNVTTFKVKKLKDFMLPIAGIGELDDEDGIEDIGITNLDCLEWPEGWVCEHGYIVGYVRDGNMLQVTQMNWGGVGSGSMWDRLMALLEQSKGRGVFTIIWEGGSVERLIVEEGIVTREVLDL